MKTVNKIILIGYVGKEPENKVLPNGMEILSFYVATSESIKDKNTGTKTQKTDWHKIVFFNESAKYAKQFIKKGNKVYIEGRMTYQKWVNKEGQQVLTPKIMGEVFSALDGPPKGETNGNVRHDSYQDDDIDMPF